MKLIFPLLTISLILGAIQYHLSTISASAQQHHSFANARNLPMEQFVCITIAANASEYCYFHSLHPQKDTQGYQITVSNSSLVSISAYNDQGSIVSFKTCETNASTWTGYLNSDLDNGRFFLVLQNLSNRDVPVQLSVQNHSFVTNSTSQKPQNDSTDSATKKPRKTSKPKTCTTKKPSKKPQKSFALKPTVDPPYIPEKSGQSSTPKNTAPCKSKKSPQAYTAKSASASSKSLPKKTQKSSTSKATTDSRDFPKNNQKVFPHNTGKPKNISDKSFDQPLPINSTRPKSDTDQSNQTLFRSNSILSSHFFRMSKGYSVSAFKLLPIHLPENQFTLENLTPDFLSLQNNIIYAKKSGLAVIRIQYQNRTTTCTLYIQETA